MKDPAPILISVYNRLYTLKQCIESLKTNKLAAESELFIVSDAAKQAKDEKIITEIRKYCNNIRGFKNVKVIKNETNKGSFLTVFENINCLIDIYGKLVFLEDDNIVSSNFLDFINQGLIYYSKEEKIFSICGFSYPIEIPQEYKFDIYFWYGFSAWGVGLWREKWLDYANSINILLNTKKRELIFNIYKIKKLGDKPCISILYNIANSNKVIDTFVNYYIYKKKMYSVFPVKNKVKNIGHDGFGEHCNISDLYKKQNIFHSEFDLTAPIQINGKIKKMLLDYFKISFFNFFFRCIRNILSIK